MKQLKTFIRKVLGANLNLGTQAGCEGDRPGPPQNRNRIHRFYWEFCVYKITKNLFEFLVNIRHKKKL